MSTDPSFTVNRGETLMAALTSERRFFPVSGRVTAEAGIHSRWLSNLYLAIGEANSKGEWVVRIYVHPLALLIWIGPLLMTDVEPAVSARIETGDNRQARQVARLTASEDIWTETAIRLLEQPSFGGASRDCQTSMKDFELQKQATDNLWVIESRTHRLRISDQPA